MSYESIDTWWWPFLFITIAGVLPTSVWRWLGVVLVGNLDDDSRWLVFIRCLATALVAAVIAQFVFTPSGVLQSAPLALRFGALAGGFALFLLARQRLVVGVVGAEIILVGGFLALGL